MQRAEATEQHIVVVVVRIVHPPYDLRVRLPLIHAQPVRRRIRLVPHLRLI